MEIRLILLKEIGSAISLNKRLDWACIAHPSFRKEKSRRRFFLLQVSLISILQKSTQSTSISPK
jgi:hypothetical protein